MLHQSLNKQRFFRLLASDRDHYCFYLQQRVCHRCCYLGEDPYSITIYPVALGEAILREKPVSNRPLQAQLPHVLDAQLSFGIEFEKLFAQTKLMYTVVP